MKTNSEWKQYEVQPDGDYYEQIQHRLRVRRGLRIGGITAGVIAIGVAAWLLTPSPKPQTVPVTPMPEASVAVAELSEVPTTEENVPITPATPTKATPMAVAEAEVAPVATQPTEPMAEPLPTIEQPDIAPETTEAVAEIVPTPTEMPIVATEPKEEVVPEEVATTDSPKAGIPLDTIPVVPNQIWTPNIIVPNFVAPDGESDDWRRFSIKFSSAVSDFKLHLYNRGGRLLYSTTDPNFEWDATHNGSTVPQGSYVWVATYRDSNGDARRESGVLTVIR